MKLFQCQNCSQLVYFENIRCVRCKLQLGYLPERETILSLQERRGVLKAVSQPRARYRFCANAQHNVCNWLVRADEPEPFCPACRHNRTIPDLSVADNLRLWCKMEFAKHRLFYTLIKLRLPMTMKPEDPDGLAFDFISGEPDRQHPVMTGHANGLITIDLAEADDPERERQRQTMGEPYRTLLGHFRHEIAHYYWDKLVAHTPALDEFRKTFGDEQQDYSAALQKHYADGPPPNWSEHFVSAYASTHPWEDFAETWAHYFHIIDTLETAYAFGLNVQPNISNSTTISAKIDFDPHNTDIDRIMDAWLPLTFAMNSINRSMGLQDLYPFVLGGSARAKLAFINRLINAAGSKKRRVATSLRRAVNWLTGVPTA